MLIMVLEDGETYTQLRGCAIMQISAHNENDMPDLDALVKEAYNAFSGRAYEPNQLYSVHVLTKFT